jgi:hypothetical protein
MKICSGQSMAEFAAAVAVLGMLTLGSISLVGLQGVQRRQIVAAREAAFQGEWLRQRSSVGELRGRLARTHFDDPSLVNATGTARLLQPADVQLTASVSGAPGRGATAVDFLFRPLRAASGFLGGGFDLRDGGFRTGVVGIDLSGTHRMPVPFDRLQLQFSQPYALLGDDWSASGPPHVVRRTAGLVPSHLLTPLSAVWRPLSVPLSLFEPSLGDLCFGLIEPDRIPEDRLGPGAAQRPAACN